MKTYISAQSWALINLRNSKQRRIVDVHGADARNHIRKHYVAVKRSVRSDKRQHLNQLAQKAEDAARREDLTAVHKCTRQRTAHGIRNEEGTLIKDPENELSVWKKKLHEHCLPRPTSPPSLLVRILVSYPHPSILLQV